MRKKGFGFSPEEVARITKDAETALAAGGVPVEEEISEDPEIKKILANVNLDSGSRAVKVELSSPATPDEPPKPEASAAASTANDTEVEPEDEEDKEKTYPIAVIGSSESEDGVELPDFVNIDRPSLLSNESSINLAEVFAGENREDLRHASTVFEELIDESNGVSEEFVNNFFNKLKTIPEDQRKKITSAVSSLGTLKETIEKASEEERVIWTEEYERAVADSGITAIADNNPIAKIALLAAAIQTDTDLNLFSEDTLRYIKPPQEIPNYTPGLSHPVRGEALNMGATAISFVATYAGIQEQLIHLFNTNPDALDKFNQMMPGLLSANNVAFGIALLGSSLASSAIYTGRKALVNKSFITGKGLTRSAVSVAAEKPYLTMALLAGLGLSAGYADIGVTNKLANLHITDQVGRTAQKDPELKRAVEQALTVRENLKAYLIEYKKFLKLNSKLEVVGGKVDKLNPIDRQACTTMMQSGWKFAPTKDAGAGSEAAYKGFIVGEQVDIEDRFKKTHEPKFEQYKSNWDAKARELGLGSTDISAYAEKLLSEVDIESTIQTLEKEVDSITQTLKKLDEEASINTLFALLGIGGYDAYTISGNVRQLEKAINNALADVAKLDNEILPQIERVYAEAMSILPRKGGGSARALTLKRPNISLLPLPGTKGEYWKKFQPDAKFSFTIAPETAEAAGEYLTRFGLPPDAFKTKWFYAYIALVTTLYLLSDIGATAAISSSQRERKRHFDEVVPERIKELTVVENNLSEQVAHLYNNKLSPMAFSLLGMKKSDVPLVTVGYVRSRMRSLAVSEVPELKKHAEWLSEYPFGTDGYLAELSVRDRDAFNAYVEWLEDWEELVKANPTKLAGLLSDLYPQYEGMISTFGKILANPDDTLGNAKKIDDLRDSVRGIHRETLRDKAQLLARRVAAANTIIERDAFTEHDVSLEQLESPDIVLPLESGRRVSFTLNQVRAFSTYQSIAKQREADLKELEHIIRTGNMLEFSAFVPGNTRQGLTVPHEFTQTFLTNARSTFSVETALVEGMRHEKELELFGIDNEIDPDEFVENISYINSHSLEVARGVIAKDIVLENYKTETTYNTNPDNGKPTITFSLRDKSTDELLVNVTYPGRIPNLAISREELDNRFYSWFTQVGHGELLGRIELSKQEREHERLRKQIEELYPRMKPDLSQKLTTAQLDTIVRYSVLGENITTMRERLSEDLAEYPLTQHDLDSFYDENINVTGTFTFTPESLSSTFSEIASKVPDDIQVDYDIDERELHIFRKHGAGNARLGIHKFQNVENLVSMLPTLNKK
jgi:hypothetical protein